MIQKFDFQELDLKGAYLIRSFYATDNRGGFIKDYNIDTFRDNGIDHDLKEVFYTISKRGVIRAMHFQLNKQQQNLLDALREKFSMYVLIYVLVHQLMVSGWDFI